MMFFSDSWYVLPWSFLLGVGVGILTGLFGAGGGFIATPILNALLGIPMNLAIGSSAFQIFGTSSYAFICGYDRRLTDWKLAFLLAPGIPCGSFLGALCIRRLKQYGTFRYGNCEIETVNLVLLSIFALFLLLIAAFMLYDSFGGNGSSAHSGLLKKFRIPPVTRFKTVSDYGFSIPVLLVIGLIVGFCSSLLGIGGGVIILPALCYLIGQETKAAIRTSLLLVFISSIFSSFFHALDGNINYLLGSCLLIGGMAGAAIGVKLQNKLHANNLKRYFAFVVLAAWVIVILKLYFILVHNAFNV